MLSTAINKIKKLTLISKKRNYTTAKIKINSHIKKEDYKGLKKTIEHYKKKGYSELSLNKCAFSILKDINPEESFFFAEKVIKEEKELSFISVYLNRLNNLGYKERAKEINKIVSNKKEGFKKENFKKIKEIILTEYMNKGFDSALLHFEESKNKNIELSLAKYIFSITKDKDTEKALNFISTYITQINDSKYLNVISNRYKKINLNEKSNLIKSIHSNKINMEEFNKNLNYLKSQEKPLIDIKQYIDITIKNNKVDNNFYKSVFANLKDVKPEYALEFGKKYINNCIKIDESFCLVFALRLMRNNKEKEAYELYLSLYKKNKNHKIESRLITSFSKLNQDKITLALNHKNPQKTIKKLLPNELKYNNLTLSKIIFEACRNNDKLSGLAIKHGEKILQKITDGYTSLAISNLYFKQGNIHDAINVKGLSLDNPKHALKLSHYCAYQKLLQNGFTLPKKLTKNITNKNVLYCLHNSLPYHSGGYATRSHGLAKGVSNNHWHIQMCSRLGYPHDLSSHKNLSPEQSSIDVVDQLNYHRLFTKINQYGVANLIDYIENYATELITLADKKDISIIHAASNFMNGIAANYAARTLGIKSVYEVRGLWEITRMSRQPEWENSQHFNMIRRMETEAAMNADAVITITHALKNEMISRGIPANKITVVSNGVHVNRFAPKSRVKELEQKMQYENKVIIGFIGSVVSYEGLEYLVEASSILKKASINNFAVMIVGDGAVLDDIKALVKKKHVQELFTFTGRVPHEQVEDYYSLVDIAPFPRKALPVCEMVSPLKPFEAMSMGKAVVSSNVAALTEIVDHNHTGITFEKNNPQSLADALKQLITTPDLRARLGEQAREWVVKEKDWSMLAEKVANVYRKINDAE